ncbi:MAG: hypothetical protein A3F70_00975 [Acidobacteria bacterium RIFCSPLOWO2_12_FULL_67_14]|nr:MAG: hypothetical protein A3H29_15075 [Acidobacteria bacterium RIFCSPLOWO2_02_FULL_67_21]OFW35551.1 MAG: hypothetical protein A3F70_00975 [Acidobacteria bacterium RIFCSPLOWO2_12_FULL_67_14]
MSKALYLGFLLAVLVAAAPLSAHHPQASLGTVDLPLPVMAGGVQLDPGTYEIRLTGTHLEPLPGQSHDAGQEVEFVAKGIVVARDFAEVIPTGDVAVGTSGGRTPRPRVERLRGDEFVRVSINQNGERYLIHLAQVH